MRTRSLVLLTASTLTLAAACGEAFPGGGSGGSGNPPSHAGTPNGTGTGQAESALSTQFPAQENRQFDILFVVDRSGSMATHVARVAQNFRSLVGQLRGVDGVAFDYRIAVTTTDLGAGGYVVDTSQFNICNDISPQGDNGALSIGPRLSANDWESSYAGQYACGDPTLGLPPGDPDQCALLTSTRQQLTTDCQGLELDPSRPYIENNPSLGRSDDDVAAQFRCIASVGVNGCFIEQPLEAARVALTNHGQDFLRPGAHLVVVFMTDEIDCSLADFSLLDPSRTDLSEDIGFRCYKEARTCSGLGREVVGGPGDLYSSYDTFTSCQDGPELVSVDEYRRYFASTALKDPSLGGRVILAGITGDPDYTNAPAPPDGPGPLDADVVFSYATIDQHPMVPNSGYSTPTPSCGTAKSNASPNPRVQALLGEFSDPRGGAPAFASICADDFSPALAALGGRMQVESATACALLPATVGNHSLESRCALEELGPDGKLRTSRPAGSGGWSALAALGTCATSSGKGGVSVLLDPALRATFEVDSQLRLSCQR
jgi:hypothetical protein